MAVGSISELVNNVTDSVIGLLDLADGSAPLHPTGGEIKKVLSTIDPSNWLKLSFPYTFAVVDITGKSLIGFGQFTSFALPLAPNAITQDESPAISIQPTQGGTTVTHAGNRYKTLSIKGTTGIAPFRGEGGVNKITGAAIFQPDDLKHKSGYEVFLRLRNWFRAYYEYKKEHPEDSNSLRLVFKNYKDGEFLIVELLSFHMERSAARSFLYDYSLEFKVLSHLSFSKPELGAFQDTLNTIDGGIQAATQAIDTGRGIFLRSSAILRNIEGTYDAVVMEPLRKAALATKALLGVGTTAGDASKRVAQSTLSAGDTFKIMSGIQEIKSSQQTNTGGRQAIIDAVVLPRNMLETAERLKGKYIATLGAAQLALDSGVFPQETLVEMEKEKEAALQLPRQFYEETISELNRVRQNLEDQLNLGDADYDALFDRTSTLAGETDKVPTLEEYEVLYGFTEAIAGLNLLLSTEDLFKSTYDARIKDLVSRFENGIELFSTNAVREILLPAGVSLERLAQKELGDSSRWGEIAEVNGLVSPYIVQDFSDTTPNVLHPGEKILIPTPAINGFSQVPPVRDIASTVDLNELERSFGTDLRINADYDLILTPAGDLEVISGTANMAQQIILKLSYEKGDLLRHPEIGAGIEVGRKFPTLKDIADNVINTLLQDPRIENIKDLSLVRENSTLFLNMQIKLKNVDIPVPVKIKVPE